MNCASGLALALGNSTLWAAGHGSDPVLPDAAYGTELLQFAPYSPQQPCTDRNCEGYDPSQLWYFDPTDGFLAQATYTSSINHCFDGGCYELTARLPTTSHRCLAHVLSVRNVGTDAGLLEVWGGPLSGGRYVVGLLNRNNATLVPSSLITAPFSVLGVPGVGPASSFCVRDAWQQAQVGTATGSFTANISAHDLGIYTLTPGQC